MSFFSWLWEMITADYEEGDQPISPPKTAPVAPAGGVEFPPASSGGMLAVVAGDGQASGAATFTLPTKYKLGTGTFALTLKCKPRIEISALDAEIKVFLNAIGYSLDDIEWQKPLYLTKYGLPKYEEGDHPRPFKVKVYKVIPGDTAGSDPVAWLKKYVDFEANYPAYDLLLTVAERDNYPVVWSGTISKAAPATLELPPGYYIVAPAEHSRFGPEFSKWWVVWGDPSDARISTWDAFKDFWGGEKITSIHRFRYVEQYDSNQWCRLMHVDRNESFNYRPHRKIKFQDWSTPPRSWDEKIAQWAEEKAEGLWSTFKGIFGQ